MEADRCVVTLRGKVYEVDKKRGIRLSLPTRYGVGECFGSDESNAKWLGVYEIWFFGDKETRQGGAA